MKLLYIGPDGSYDHIAVIEYLKQADFEIIDPVFLPQDSYAKIAENLSTHGSDTLGFFPIENKISGDILVTQEILDNLDKYNLSIVSQITIPVIQCLLSKSEDLSMCTNIYLDKDDISQCSNFLETINLMKQIPAANPAEAISKSIEDDLSCVIGTTEMANLYKMNILNIGVGNDSENWTRFVIVKPKLDLVNTSSTLKSGLNLSKSSHELLNLKNRIEEIDKNILDLIKKRVDLASEVDEYKKTKNLPLTDQEEERSSLEKKMEYAKENGLDENLIYDIWRRLL
jgi:chorismate mutase/prephenate dehydratase